MTTARAALAEATRRLERAGVPEPARDARRLMAFALNAPHDRLTLLLPEPLSGAAQATFGQAISRREQRQPVAQITGKRAFYGRDFLVTPDVLDPRPETELLVRRALEHGADGAGRARRILDLGTGSGAILVSCLAELPGAEGLGTDISAAALTVARRNAHTHRVAARAGFAVSDWYEAVTGRFDLILSNPPYIAADEMQALAPDIRNWEPAIALTPGGDGLSAYRKIVARAGNHLRQGGALIVETGAAQAGAVRALFAAAGFSRITVSQDLDGRDRVVSGVI